MVCLTLHSPLPIPRPGGHRFRRQYGGGQPTSQEDSSENTESAEYDENAESTEKTESAEPAEKAEFSGV